MVDPIPRTVSRRELLALLGAGTVAALSYLRIQPSSGNIINLPVVDSDPKGVVVPSHFQLDLDSNITLARATNFDSVEAFARETGLPADVIRTTNGVAPNEYYIGGEFLLLPTNQTSKFLADRRIENPSDHDIVSNVVARVLPRPEIGQEDFTPEELRSFNVFARRASRELRSLLGPPTNTGLLRIQGGTQQEKEANKIAENGAWIIEVEVPNRFSNVGLNSSPWVSRIFIADRFEANLPNNATREPYSYRWERYLANANSNIRHEVAHYYLGGVDLSPFDNHNLVYAVGSLAYEEIPDRGYVVDGIQHSPAYRSQNTVEWYLIRQNPLFFAHLIHWAREKIRTTGQPTPQEVLAKANQIDRGFNQWKGLFDSPIGRNPIKDSDGILRTWDVRWPNGDEMAQGWFADYEVGSTVSGGLRLYRSHRKA